ncbi:MAG: RNA polymerase sigma-70 factor [Bacteroidales bacterium]|jgi:RNA polymerase sigma-70 factor (ECF subfamily)
MTLERDSFFDKAYLQYFPKVQHFAYSYLNDNEGANSVAQEVFMSVWEDKDKFSQAQDILGYLIVLTRNRCLNILRRRVIEEKFKSNRSKQLLDQINYQALSNNIVSNILEKEVSTIVTSTLNKMPDKVKATFLLSRSGNLKQHEIARLQGVALRTVESRLKKAVTILKKSLKDYLSIALLMSIINSLIKS